MQAAIKTEIFNMQICLVALLEACINQQIKSSKGMFIEENKALNLTLKIDLKLFSKIYNL